MTRINHLLIYLMEQVKCYLNQVWTRESNIDSHINLFNGTSQMLCKSSMIKGTKY